MAKAAARAKVFEMMDLQSTKLDADLMKRKNSTIQSRAIERDICDDVLITSTTRQPSKNSGAK